jgi:gamma-glutamylcyclotransferase (GGCT)/AIG2-like uncharacterized protein YtfP
MDRSPLCHCGAASAEGWYDRAPGWPLCADHAEADETGTVDVFVYGTLKQAYGNFAVVDDLFESGAAGTVSGFKLIDLGSFPAALVSDGETIRGELLTLNQPSTALRRLDRLEGVPTLYTRETVTVALDDGTEKTAFMYVLAGVERSWSRGDAGQNDAGEYDWHPAKRGSYRW